MQIKFSYSGNKKIEEDAKFIDIRLKYLCSAILLLASFVIFIIISFNLNADFFKNKFFLFILSGVLVGIYYGLFNDYIYQYPKERSFKYRNEFARINTFWVHIISGFIAGVAANYFVSAIQSYNFLDLKHLILFLIALGGYTGLLPRWIWFFASRGGPGEPTKS